MIRNQGRPHQVEQVALHIGLCQLARAVIEQSLTDVIVGALLRPASPGQLAQVVGSPLTVRDASDPAGSLPG